MLKAEVMETMYGCVTCSPTDCSAASDGREYVATVITCYRVQTTMGKRRILFAGFVARMDNERLLRRVMFGQVEGGKVHSGGQEQDWMGCLERDLSLFNLPTEAKHWTLAAKKPGEWFRRVEEAAEQYTKR